MTRIFRAVTSLAAGLLTLAACASTPPAAITATITGSDTYADFLGEPNIPAPDLVGVPFHGGDVDGPLPPLTVREASDFGCTGITLTLGPAARPGTYIAYSKPAQFFALEDGSDLRLAVLEQAEPVIQAQGGDGPIYTDDIRRLDPGDGNGARVVALARTQRPWEAPAAADKPAYDVLLLFREDAGALSLLDALVSVTPVEDGVRDSANFIAAAVNPFTGHLELFASYSGHEYTEVTGYDLSADTLEERASYDCAL